MNKKLYLSVVFILMFFGNIYIRFCSDPVFHNPHKALTVAAVLGVFVGRVRGSCWTDGGCWLGYLTWKDEKSWHENFWDCAVFRHVCWFTEKKKQNFFFTLIFCFLRARASAAFNFLSSLLSRAKSSERYS